MRRLTILSLLALASCKVGVDINEGRGYACAPEGGAEQCATGWRCGLEGFCPREGEPRPWQCDSNSRCELQ